MSTTGTLSGYMALEDRFARLADINNALGVLSWDRSTMMPKGAAEGRGDQMATLGGLAHAMLSAAEVGDWLAQAETANDSLDIMQQANLREMRRAYSHATAVPQALVEALSRACNRSEMLWRQARAEANFEMLRPALEEVLRLTVESATAKGEALGCKPYEALLDTYDPGLKPALIDSLFADLAGFLPGFLDLVTAHQAAQPVPDMPVGPFPIACQEQLARRLMQAAGFSFDYGRLDTSAHPFCGGGGHDDVRITTRYDETDFTTAMMGVMHETGHALYDNGLPKPWRRQLVGQARGMTMHESQSLLMEMQACRSAAFMRFLSPLVRECFGAGIGDWTPEALAWRYTRVKPGFIRVDADEVTYPAHVILRYRLERAMVAGDLAVADLPGAWNDGMAEMLGVTPPDDRVGCLQDIHWPDGAFGYFPTYTLGALTAAQLFAAVRRDLPDLDRQLEIGDFSGLLTWLRERVHGVGSAKSTAEIIEGATGSPLGTAAFKAHLQARYLS